MRLPKLSPLQARFAASLGATILLLLLLYLTLTQPKFAYAHEIDSIIPSDHNHPIIFEEREDLEDLELPYDEVLEITDLKTRADADVQSLFNNAPLNKNILPGESQTWVVSQQVINGPPGEAGVGLPQDANNLTKKDYGDHELRRRQSGNSVWITINTCLQPRTTSTNTDDADTIPPQLLLYISTSTDNQSPGPGATGDQTEVEVDNGFAKIQVTADNDVYVGVAGPSTTEFSGSWNYEIAASIDAPFHDAGDEPSLLWVDGDSHAALLVTPDLTDANPDQPAYQEWMNLDPPYGMFAQNQQNRSILGLSRSYCGLLNNAKIVDNLQSIQNQNIASMTSRGLGGKPKEQFYIGDLDPASNYWGFLAMQGNSTASGEGVVGGGGKVWTAVNFTTKADSNCALMYNLSFCSEVAYAVPTNPNTFPPAGGIPQLAALYDNYTQQMYQYFTYVLQQIPCNVSASSQYSLARNCDDCARAYKQWVCAVSIPRCEDWDNPAPWLKPRNMAQNFVNGSTPDWFNNPAFMDSSSVNSSRNSLIDTQIQPGPYKEVLPCADLCYDLVQSCSAAMGFGCPMGQYLNESYGHRSQDPGTITCSYLGAAYYLSGASSLGLMGGLGGLVLWTCLFGLALQFC